MILCENGQTNYSGDNAVAIYIDFLSESKLRHITETLSIWPLDEEHHVEVGGFGDCGIRNNSELLQSMYGDFNWSV